MNMDIDRLMNKTIPYELRSILLERTGLDTLPERIWKRMSALNTWGTNAIEGSTLTREETEKLVIDGTSIKGRSISEVLETVQHDRVFRSLPGMVRREISLEMILHMHEQVFFGILPDAGQWRRVNVRIRGASFSPPRMEKVVREMERWATEYRERDIKGGDTFELAASTHFDFEKIHPFSDGNGRIGRLLLNLHFLKRNWPPVHVLPEHRKQYLDGLNRADAEGDLSSLIKLLEKLMGGSLLGLLDEVGTAEDELVTLAEAAENSPYSVKYLGLRCKQGMLPAVRSKRNKWLVSRRVLRLYREHAGRR